jgi:hypothetical protein
MYLLLWYFCLYMGHFVVHMPQLDTNTSCWSLEIASRYGSLGNSVWRLSLNESKISTKKDLEVSTKILELNTLDGMDDCDVPEHHIPNKHDLPLIILKGTEFRQKSPNLIHE